MVGPSQTENCREEFKQLLYLALPSLAFLLFQNPRLLDDVSFHPCVRFKRWESERILSFIPPDGNFRLLSYHVSAQK